MAVLVDQIGDGVIQLIKTSDGHYSIWIRSQATKWKNLSYGSAVEIYNLLKADYYRQTGRAYDQEDLGPSIFWNEGKLKDVVFVTDPRVEEKKAMARTYERMHETRSPTGLPPGI
jgi:hypothetical protein